MEDYPNLRSPMTKIVLTHYEAKKGSALPNQQKSGKNPKKFTRNLVPLAGLEPARTLVRGILRQGQQISSKFTRR